jgi:diguanylate cyclase (GGDEF)-like protein/PAS domain S-box-containing protein
MRLQIKTSVTFLLLSLLPLLLTGIVAYPVALSAMKTSLGTSFRQIAHETMDKVDRSVYEVYQNVLTWSKLEIMQEILTGDLDGKISTYLMEVEREYGYFANIVAVNREGKVVAASHPELIGRDARGEEFHRRAMSGEPFVDDVHRDRSSQEWVVTFAFPVRAQFMNDKIVGVLCALWNADELGRLTQSGQAADQSGERPEVFLTRRDGLLIAAPEAHRDSLFRDNLIVLGLRSASLAVNQSEGYLIEDVLSSGESLVGYSSSKGHRDYPGFSWGSLVSQDTSTAFAPIRRLNLIILFIGTVVALTVSVMSVVVSRRMARPILGISAVARRVSQGDFSGTAEHSSPDEIGALANVFNQMIVDLKRQREQLVEKHYVDSIIANMMNSLIVIDASGVIRTANHATLTLLGYGEGELVGQSAQLIFPPALWAREAWVDSLVTGNPAVNRETTYRSKDGRSIPVLFSAAAMRNEQGHVQGIVCVAQDLTERKRAEETLAEQAIRDALTGLYNRRYFDRRIRSELARAERSRQPMAMLLCDLDRFKAVNDTRGHQAGDESLKLVSKAVLNSVRGIDLVFRWGGDEIMVVLPETTREGARTTAERIRAKIRHIAGNVSPDLDVSTGIALYPEHGSSEDDLIRIADLALYISKKGGDKIHVGAEEYDLDKTSSKVTFQPAVAVQPIVDLRSKQIIGYEALTRDPAGKVSVLELFKKYEIIGKLGELKWVCFQVQLKAAQEAGLHTVFINVDFALLSTYGLVPKPAGIDVVLEISELEALHDIDAKLEVANRWRRLGYKFAIDDFGAGFISLPFVARLVPDYLKIDRSTILQAVSAAQFKEFLAGLVVALKSYATHGIIAEGIETEQELRTVEELGVSLVQGFLFGRPYELKTGDPPGQAAKMDPKRASNA